MISSCCMDPIMIYKKFHVVYNVPEGLWRTSVNSKAQFFFQCLRVNIIAYIKLLDSCKALNNHSYSSRAQLLLTCPMSGSLRIFIIMSPHPICNILALLIWISWATTSGVLLRGRSMSSPRIPSTCWKPLSWTWRPTRMWTT